ncbi:MAG: hypothetical protein KIT84_37280 [Labilithrix sp.]|nr:hypothetical protein [Labilithrix sp.]MCW5816712.1 hypothetical protein [Labilithrix sp.]
MEGWFKPSTATVDFLVACGVAMAIGFWAAEPLGKSGLAALVAGAFAATQVARFVGAQLATLEWARMEESAFVERVAKVGARGDGYRAAAAREDAADDGAREAEEHEQYVQRRRSSAQRRLGIVGAIGAGAALVPGFVYGLWIVPGVVAFLGVLLSLFFVAMRAMRRRHAREADAVLRRRVEPPRVRLGVDFGVPADEREEEREADGAEPEYARRTHEGTRR